MPKTNILIAVSIGAIFFFSIMVAILVVASRDRRPTLDELTYFESTLLVDAEIRKLDWLKRVAAESGTRETQESFDRQAERVRDALEVARKAHERESSR